MKRKDYKIGKTIYRLFNFTIYKLLVKKVSIPTCIGCAFNLQPDGKICGRFACQSLERKDRACVIFEKV